MRRSQLLSLRETAADLGTRLGGADVVIPYHKSLPLTFEQVRILNSRLKNRADLVSHLVGQGKGATVEVVAPQDEFTVDRSGVLLIPCNISGSSLLFFFKDFVEMSRSVSKSMLEYTAKIENCRAQCELHLGLASMEWEQGLGLEELLQSMERLRGLDDSVKSLFQGLSIKLSRNPSVYVMNDGKVSVPLNWI